MKFISFKYWLNENQDQGITVLFPGSFKPMHYGHIDLILRYASHPEVKEVKVLVGPGIRNGIDQHVALKIAKELLSSEDKISVELVKYPSSVRAVYQYIIEEAKSGTYAMARADKDKGSKGYSMVTDFVKSFNEGGKYYSQKSPDVNVVELSVDVNPVLYKGRTDENEGFPISASILRQDVLHNNYENFKTNYPGYDKETISTIWDLIKQNVSESIKIFEGGSAIDKSKSLSKEELLGTWDFVKTIAKKLNIPESAIQPAGSFSKKPEGETYGDIDVLVDVKMLDTNDPLNYVYDELTKLGYDAIKYPGFSQVTAGIPINGDQSQGFAQVDFMLSKHVPWSKYVYDSPNLTKKESKYKSVYAGHIFMAIISEAFKKVEKRDEEGRVLQYSMLSYRFNEGIFKVLKTHEGKRGYIKTSKIISDEFVTNNPDDAIELAFGKKYRKKLLSQPKAFETYWKILTSSDFIHKNKLNAILDKFKYYLDTDNMKYPQEAIDDFPEIFGKIQESLNEEVSTRKVNTHIKHIEELLFEGTEGVEFIKYTLQSLVDKLAGKSSDISLSVKIDGAPTMMAWSKFPGLKPYGVGTKTVFNKEPITCHTPQEIDSIFGDRPELVEKLKGLLKYLRKIQIPSDEIWQGDFLFNDDIIVKDKTTLSFRPNTIKYVVEKNSEIGKKIDNAEFGIVWHTRYTGNDITSVDSNFNVDISRLQETPGIYMSEPYIKQIPANTKNDTNDLQVELDSIFKKLDKLHGKEYDEFLQYKSFTSLFHKYHNQVIRNQEMLEKTDFIDEFMKFAKKEKGVKAVSNIEKFINKNSKLILLIVNIISDLTILKKTLIRKLNEFSSYKSYIELKSGKLKSINQEGFAISSPSGNVTKLVDREEFSFSNFSPDVKKGWVK